MFWKRIDIETPQEQRDDLRQALADRLMVALDFATLGAYELSGPDVATEETHCDAPASEETGQPSRRSCASSDARRRHVTAVNLPCPAPEQARTASACERGSRRGGSVAKSEQPCTWSDS